MGSEVRVISGVPTAGAFALLSGAPPSSPIVINSATDTLYYLNAAGVVKPLAGSFGAITPTSVKPSTVGGYISSDGSAGFTGTLTTASLVGKTVTFKDGIITSIV